ncbi:recombinase zinc beta ribbon domain-containing protein [Paenibacillus sp. FSL M7-1455]|uniref:zinc ribbon domain-containing protein n=1 Tax=Paenibacillus sp. FSL M7-1455 TaxID=2975316 RepID=UPI0030FB0212
MTQELWDKVQARYANANKHPARVYYGSFPFTGVMRCPVCGHGMVAQRATRKSKKTVEIKYTPYYQCGQFANKGTAVCRANSVRADYAELEDLTASINGKRTVDKKPLEQELQRIEKEIADIERKKEKYYRLYEEDMLEPKELKAKINELSEIGQRLEQRQATLRKEISLYSSAPVSSEAVRGLLASFGTIFENISHEKRKQIVHTLIRQITITNDRKIDRIELRLKSQQLLMNEEHGICEQNLAL